MTFQGAKVALFLGDQLVVILRDDVPGIAWPGMWDLPGGGREGDETAFATMAREVEEELGLVVPQSAVLWQAEFAPQFDSDACVVFFVAQMMAATADRIVFGDEGQRWALMAPSAFVALPNVVPSYAARLARWRRETGGLEGNQ